VFTVRTISLNE